SEKSRFSRKLSAGRYRARRAARPDARGDRAVAEPPRDGAADPARHRGGSAQPADAHQGVRPFGAIEKGGAAPYNIGGIMIVKIMKRTVLVFLFGIIPSLAAAQSGYPSKPVRVIVPFAP